jgi:hypothetical protein
MQGLRTAIWTCDVDAIRKYTGDINLPDRHGHTPLRMALLPMRGGSTLEQRLAVLNALSTKANFRVDEPCGYFTALTWTAHDDRLDVSVLRWLIETGGADVNGADELGSFAIHRAVESGVKSDDTRKIEYLLSLEHLDARVRDGAGCTAFDIALRYEKTWGPAFRDLSETLESRVRVRCLAAGGVVLRGNASVCVRVCACACVCRR